jgi:class 3 adenylate cyclase
MGPYPTTLLTYLPQDRRQALARGDALPHAIEGTALFADISGFTALTETLTQQLSARRGIEALSLRINAVYEALIGEVERAQGSVIGFAGDAITCWFDQRQPNAAARALHCAAGEGLAQAGEVLVDVNAVTALALPTEPCRRHATVRRLRASSAPLCAALRVGAREHGPRPVCHRPAPGHRAAGLLQRHAVCRANGCGIGTLRVGAYGSTTRRSFGAMGDEVNFAARLMVLAQPGEI